jgi:hypothetical protein
MNISQEQMVGMIFELVKEEVKRVGLDAVEVSNVYLKAVDVVNAIVLSQTRLTPGMDEHGNIIDHKAYAEFMRGDLDPYGGFKE